jgi:hypothetical protein
MQGMKKKRIVFPEKVKPWIEARTRFKLSHEQIEMARELGMEPNKFGGIASHLKEQGKQSLAEFIDAEYVNRFGKTGPDDRRSIEQKLKAENAEKEQKRSAKAQAKATAKWDLLPAAEKAKIVDNVWCDTCEKTTTMIEIDCQTMNSDLILSGKCAACGNAVGRFVEGD